jgi:hypothetical protein
LKDIVLAALRDYAAGKTGSPPSVAGAIASHFLAVATPNSIAIIGNGAESLEAHRTWFNPRDVRSTVPGIGRLVTIEEALAADIVCVHEPMTIAARQLRRGTHINALAQVTLDEELRALATIHNEHGLTQLAAGMIDGRQLDELTVFVAG